MGSERNQGKAEDQSTTRDGRATQTTTNQEQNSPRGNALAAEKLFKQVRDVKTNPFM